MDTHDIAKDVRDLKRRLLITINECEYGTRIIAFVSGTGGTGNVIQMPKQIGKQAIN